MSEPTPGIPTPGPLDLLIEGAGEVFTALGDPLSGAVVGVAEGVIAYVGDADGLSAAGWSVTEDTERVDAEGGLITPGLVECHTHIVFGGDRSGEYAQRATGTPYLEIARAGGGINATVQATRAASFDSLLVGAQGRLNALVRHGVTTCEIKSGYGLDPATELKMLQVAAALDEANPVSVIGTFLGAHTLPADWTAGREAYVAQVIDEMIPEVARQKLARFCDVFVEKKAFSVAEGRAVLEAGMAHGMRPKVHADQLSAGGGAGLAAEVGAVSADHLEYISPEDTAAMAEAGTVAVLLPGASLFLGQDVRPPARALIDAGVPVALSTDCNPGTCMSTHLPLMLTLGMSRLGLSPAEALRAVTIEAAKALDLADVAGAIAVGRPADLALFGVPSHAHLPYQMGDHLTRRVWASGETLWQA